MIEMRILSLVVLGILTLLGFGLGAVTFNDAASGRAGVVVEVEAMIAILIGTVAFTGIAVITAIERTRVK